MTLWTWSQIKTKIQNDLDLTDQIMITEEELLAYVNQAIDECEQMILGIYEDYLLQSTALALVTGTSEYALPTNIYAHKIRKIFYDDGNTRYEIKRIRNLVDIPEVDDNDDYRYIVTMNSSGAFRVKLYPESRETSASNVTVWHIGNARTLADDADEMNLPEAAHYVIARAKLECARKEGHPIAVALAEEVAKQQQLLVDSLSAMVPDEDNKIMLDTSFYDDVGYSTGWGE